MLTFNLSSSHIFSKTATWGNVRNSWKLPKIQCGVVGPRNTLELLREGHQLKHNTKPNSLSVGDVVIIKSDERNRNQWPMGVVEDLFTGRDGVVRAAKLRAGRGFMERPIQHLYPLELSCDRNPTPCNDTPLNRTAVKFRSRRDADVAARQQIQDIVEEDTWMWLPKKHFYTYFLLCYRVSSTCICIVPSHMEESVGNCKIR